MEVTIAKKCPNCDYVLRVKKPSTVILQEDPTLSERIRRGNFSEYKCPKCGEIINIVYPFAYIDEERSLYLRVTAKEEDVNNLIADIQDNIEKYRIVRIVSTFFELAEKIVAFEHDKDDRIIELCKVYYRMLLKEKKPDFITGKVSYFSDPDDSSIEIFRFRDINKNDLYYRLNIDDYNVLFLKFYNTIEEEYSDTVWYDSNFGDNFIYSHLEELKKRSDNILVKAISTTKTITSDIFQCRRCGARVDAEDLCCKKCGIPIIVEYKKKYCKYCGKQVEEGDSFCKYCGKAQ